jgi:DNA-binding MarR family transcriptional regulator
VSVHDQVIPVALAREERLLAGFTAEEAAQVRAFLARMLENVPAMNTLPQSGADNSEPDEG